MPRPCSVLLALAATLAAAAPAGAASPERDWPCRSPRAQVLAASDQARIVVLPGQADVFGCATPLSAGDGSVLLGSASIGGYGALDLKLAGRFAAYRSIGDGCGRGTCVGPVAYVVDLHDGRERGPDGMPRRRERELRGAVDVAIWRDGRVVTIEVPPQPGYAGPAPLTPPDRVVLRTRDGRTRVLDRGPGIEAGSLTTFGRVVQWRRGGRLRAARVLPR